jgi:hypothetical protein
MTYIESPIKTIEKFIPSWRHTQTDRLSQEIISAFNETHRKPDEYKFKFKEGRLVDFPTETEINIDTSTYLGEKDAELLSALTYWVSENPSGTALWISPSYDSAYPCNKITMYQIEETPLGEKSTFNITVLFDTSKENTLEIAAKLNPAFAEVYDPEVLRNKLIVVDEKFGLGNLLELIGVEAVGSGTVPSREVIHQFIDLIHSGVSSRFIAQEMQEKGLIGEFSVSCGGSSSISPLEGNSLTLDFTGLEDKYGSLSFTCPKCGSTNIRPFGQLISNCQHCGGDVRC